MHLPAAARAQPAALTLTWTAPPGCPDADAVLRRVRDLRASDHPTAPLPATATVTRDARRWRVRIETPGGARSDGQLDGDRRPPATAAPRAARRPHPPHPPRCPARSLTRPSPRPPRWSSPSPSTTPRPRPRPPSPRPALPPEVEQITDTERPPVLRPAAPAPPPPPRPRWSLGARALIDANALPDTGFGVLLTAAWRSRGLRVELAPTVAFASRGAPSPQGASLAALRVSLATRLCLTGRDGAVGLCLLADLGWLRARSQGFTVPGDGDAPWFQAGASVFARVGTGRTTGIFVLDLAAPITRPQFVIQGSDAGWEVPAVTVMLSGGVSVEM
jgi:hypothetical protein